MGYVDEDSDLLHVAARRWPDWTKQDHRLPVVTGVRDLRSWLKKVSTAEADRVLYALAKRAAVHGGDDRVAASTLAFALLPGACPMACRLSTLAPNVDEIIAAQLWIEIRSFPWQRLTKVAAIILMNTRPRCSRSAGRPAKFRSGTRPGTARCRSTRTTRSGGDLASRPPWSRGRARPTNFSSFAWPCDNKVITARDRSLLLSLAEAADRAEIRRSDGRAGLLSEEIAEIVDREYGLAAITVRRRAGRTLRALSEACVGRETSA